MALGSASVLRDAREPDIQLGQEFPGLGGFNQKLARDGITGKRRKLAAFSRAFEIVTNGTHILLPRSLRTKIRSATALRFDPCQRLLEIQMGGGTSAGGLEVTRNRPSTTLTRNCLYFIK